MSLLQIHEPGQTPHPHEENGKIAVGIDLGTTNSLVAVAKDGKVEVLADENGNALQPSIVSYLGAEIKAGMAADLSGSAQTVKSIKRLMGRGEADIRKISGSLPYKIHPEGEGMVRLDIGGKAVTPVEVSARILSHLKNMASQALGGEVEQAVVTVPAYFDDAARSATVAAAKLAGLEVLRLVNEPTAAALAYGLDKGAEGVYAVYDLGGGTFDISILRMQKGVFQVLATGGSIEIGGDDFDREIAEIFLWQCRNSSGKALKPSTDELNSILTIARKAKEYLTENESGEFTINTCGQDYEVTISRAEFEKSIKPYVSATLDICEGALADAGVATADIKGVVLVGGSTRVPLVRKAAAEILGKEPLADIDPDKVVAQGAALQAEGLTRGSDNLLLDVVPLSLGIETMGSLVEKVIHRNTPIPVAKAQEFTTYKDGQTAMSIHVVQGEREMAPQNRSLAKFTLSGIPPMVAGAARIKVTFAVDADGLLTVSAKEETTGVEQKVEVKPSYGISEEEMTKMLYASMENAKNDMEQRLLAEAKVEANRLLLALDSAIAEDAALLTEDEAENIKSHRQKLEKELEGADRDAINKYAEELEHSCSSFVEKRMNKTIAAGLRGRKVDDA